MIKIFRRLPLWNLSRTFIREHFEVDSMCRIMALRLHTFALSYSQVSVSLVMCACLFSVSTWVQGHSISPCADFLSQSNLFSRQTSRRWRKVACEIWSFGGLVIIHVIRVPLRLAQYGLLCYPMVIVLLISFSPPTVCRIHLVTETPDKNAMNYVTLCTR